MKAPVAFLALALGGVVSTAHAEGASDCDATTINALVPANARKDGVLSQACKAWPHDPSVTLAAVAWSTDSIHGDTGPDRKVHEEVAMLRGGRVVARHSRVQQEDATTGYSDNSLKIDSAAYDLAPGVRAFGVVFDSSANGPSCPDAWQSSELTLYVPTGSALRPVYTTYRKSAVAIDEAALCPMAEAKVRRSESGTITLAMGSGSSHGYRDLVQSTRIERLRDGDTQGTRTEKRVLHFDGTRYGSADPYENGNFWQKRAKAGH